MVTLKVEVFVTMGNSRWGVKKWNGVDKVLASVVLSGVMLMGVSVMALTSGKARATGDSEQTLASVTIA